MNISKSHIRPFPAYEDVFEGDVERYRQHFLPIISVNLQCLFPGEDQWLHFVSVKEIYDGSVGEETVSEHRQFTKEDMLGFDVVNGKYRFEADWNYFLLEQEPDHETLIEAYADNERDFMARKQFYEEQGHIFPYSSFGRAAGSANELKREYQEKLEKGWGLSFPEINGLLDDIGFMSDEAQRDLQEEGESLEDWLSFEQTNLLHVPRTPEGNTFTYIGRLTGYYFQAYGADALYLFYSKELRKAVICLEYT
ncbi:siderophore biosynthesis protein [Paenibacillus sp. NPDC093718]|uniref:siderophore biosynthesis protein n=1 Tax=Paenibacillus sp. NPDC093718 TaxID=3390601 RepID=UPI003CFF32EA